MTSSNQVNKHTQDTNQIKSNNFPEIGKATTLEQKRQTVGVIGQNSGNQLYPNPNYKPQN